MHIKGPGNLAWTNKSKFFGPFIKYSNDAAFFSDQEDAELKNKKVIKFLKIENRNLSSGCFFKKKVFSNTRQHLDIR